ncbi:MFS transporter, DHA1 family, arabinose polymer transporter [Flavobacterium flevense]|uniref:MFS transporter AraJ n=1 Tax=Flavobacterium flevense TaxID=983 RepID=A0A4Y4AWP4_9FLAO|nr:MFS transporter [Flavobacterium flevense]GEC71759.1 MFS transporter AraJ [Flavobacterium flevense]SHL38436.1 MFS transporter, DHA1 family, arabinose polymer transporter [Flavobacterium flevense]
MKKSLLSLSLGGLTIGITEFVMMGILPDIAKNLNISIPVAGHLISAYALGVVIGAPLLVIITRNYPPKKTLLILAMMITAFNSLSIIAPNYEFLFAVRLLSGLPHGAFFGVGAVVASRLADKGKEAQAISVMFAGLTIANLLGVPLGTCIGHHFSWRYTFIIIAIVGTLTVASLYFWMPNVEAKAKEAMRSQLQFFKKAEAWLVILITAIGAGGLFCWISYIAPLLTDISGFDAADVPYIMMLAGLGMVLGNFIGGKLADRYSAEKTIIVLLSVMALDLLLVFFFSSNPYVSLALVFSTGCIAFAVAAPIQTLMIQTAVGAEMIASAAIQAAFNTGNALGAFLGGLPLVAGFSYASPNLVGITMSILGVLFTIVFLQRKRRMLKLQAI